MFLGPDRPMKYQNVKILFTFQAYVLVTEMTATWVASVKNVASVKWP